jgi:hypothetical protein
MANLENRHADARKRHQVTLCFLEHGQRQDGRSGREIENPCSSHDDSFMNELNDASKRQKKPEVRSQKKNSSQLTVFCDGFTEPSAFHSGFWLPN